MANECQIIDNSDIVLKDLENKAKLALETIGMMARDYARDITPVDTSRLVQNINFRVNGYDVYIGTNVEYAPYVEFGTGIYASNGKGRKSPWAYQDKDGKWHRTRGMKPHHMLKKAVQNHGEEYKAVVENYLKRK